MNNNFKFLFFKISFILLLLLVFTFLSAKSYSNIMSQNISNEFLRLHVIANSDSTEDQLLKYKVRDAVLSYIEPFFINIKSKEEAISMLNLLKDDLEDVIDTTLKENNFDYPFSLAIDNFYFPTKEYSNFILPNGYYDALQIKIGNATGQNWWCVMFPSLCINDSSYGFSKSSDEYLQEALSTEEYKVITTPSQPSIKIKFKLIELFENI